MLRNFRPSPIGIVLAIGCVLLFVLTLRGLDMGPLHTDMLIFRAWAREVGAEGFSQRYFDVNQRHLLVGPLYSLLYRLFGEQDLPFNLIFQASRVVAGIFLAGIVDRLTGRRSLALCAGLALMLTLIRVPELYQGINWHVEPTLGLLLASSYLYLRSLRAGRWKLLWYFLSVLAYTVSILLYEAGLPWILVNLLLGWFARPEQPARTRLWRTVRDALPSIVIALALAYAILFVFEPWGGLAPRTDGGFIVRLARQLGTPLAFPTLYLHAIRTMIQGGYFGLLTLFVALAVGVVLLLSRALPPEPQEREPFRDDFFKLLVLAATMLFAGVLVGASGQDVLPSYLDRITFGRAAGISLLSVTLLWGAFRLVRIRWWQTAAAAVTAALLVGPGFAWSWVYQDYAHQARAEIERITTAVLNVRGVMYAPVHLIVVTDPDWVGARFADAADVIVHEVQQQLWQLGGDATIDILHTGAYPEEYATLPDTCETVSGQYSAGLCVDETQVYGSRWSFGPPHPNADVVMLRYDDRAGAMAVVPAVHLSELEGYNLTTAGPQTLATNPERLAIPLAAGS